MVLFMDNRISNLLALPGIIVHNLATSISAIAARKTEGSVPELIEALKYEEPEVRWYAAWTLSTMGGEAKAAIPALIEALKDEQGEVRQMAAKALSSMGSELEIPIPVLKEALNDTERDVRRFASKTLARITSGATVKGGVVEK